MAIYNGRILMRKGLEADFDASKLISGEWALSTDKGIVRICLEAGKVIRMATYEAFEKDMEQIEAILLECKSIEEAVRRINTEVSTKLSACAEYVQQAKNYSDLAKTSEANAKSYMQSAKKSEENAKTYETNAKASENSAKESENIAKLTEERAREVFESIPEDYSTISNDFYELAIKETATGEEIHVNDSSNLKLREFALFGKARQNTTTGKNLLENTATSQTVSGVTFTVNEDKSIKISGKATATASYFIYDGHGDTSLFNGKYLSGCNNGSSSTYFLRLSDVKNASANNYAEDKKIENLTNTGLMQVFIRVMEGVTVDTTIYPMISDNGGEYEPFTNGASPNPQYPQPIEVSGESGSVIVTSSNEDNTKTTTATIPTENGLAGIKVSSGGNYTDQNGQQWICDEVVKYADGSGEHIQKVLKDSLNGTEYWKVQNGKYFINQIDGTTVNGINPKFISTVGAIDYKILDLQQGYGLAYAYGYRINFENMNVANNTVEELKAYLNENPITVYIELKEPIRTPLTVEEIAEIEKLHTFYPITNISNDADCGMSVTYYADSKNYIDKKISELATAMVNNI